MDPGLGSVHVHSRQEIVQSCATFIINVAGPHRVSELAEAYLQSPHQQWQVKIGSKEEVKNVMAQI
jgi:hypothetical protein